MGGELLADPVAETRQLISRAAQQGLLMRALGGVAVFLQSPGGEPRLPRRVKDIDLAVARGTGKAASRVLTQAAYVGDEMFNALRGSRRLLYHDPRNGRHVDVFVGEFSMCHELPLTTRLDRDPLTVPREELLLSKLQIVELTENDQVDIYTLLYHHDVGEHEDAGIASPFVAALCARDWGLWRTCQMNIGRSLDNLGNSGLDQAEQKVIGDRLQSLRGRMDAEPKTRRWRIRSQLGDKVRWYAEPEQEQPGGE
jgi:hypothetical protein